MAELKLLPLPKSVRRNKGTFKLEDGLPIIVGPSGDKEVNAAWSFAGEAEDRTGLLLPVERMGKLDGIRRRILFLITGRDERLYPPLAELAKGLARAPKNVRDQAYALKVARDEVVAVATSPRGLYYAAQTLRQLLTSRAEVPCVRITDWPTYAHRGVMLDISRFKVPTLDTLFERIERLASLKINCFQLYTEHTFVFRRHPEIGRNCGSMTAEDVIQLDEFCKQHFVDLNANLQSFGHHRHLLSIPRYNHLAEMPDAPWTLCPVDRRIYDLLDDMYAECLPAYSSKLFNASCDETRELGKGRSAKRAARVGVGRVYVGHIRKINRLARKYGKRTMIWADIVLKHPECLPHIPKDVIMLEWGYSAGSDLSVERKLQAAGLEHWTCPGVSTWTRIFANVPNACANIAERAVMGQRTGATGLLNTDWGDGGHAQMPSASYHGYAWGAEQSWTPKLHTDRDGFDRRFAWAWFGDDTGLFGKLYKETGRMSPEIRRVRGLRPFRLYWDVFPCAESLQGLPPGAVRRIGRHARRALDIVSKLAKLHPEHGDVLREVLFGLAQIVFIEGKVAASRQIDALRARGVEKLPAAMKKAVRALLKEWNTQREEFEELWMETSRRSEIAYRLGLYRKRARDYRKLLK